MQGPGKVYGSFGALAAGTGALNQGMSQTSVGNKEAIAHSASVHNFYGQGIAIQDDVVGEIGVSVSSDYFPDNSRNPATWEAIDQKSFTIPIGISGTAPDGSELAVHKGSLDLGTGVLDLGNNFKVKLPKTPAQILITALANNKQTPIPDTVGIVKFV